MHLYKDGGGNPKLCLCGFCYTKNFSFECFKFNFVTLPIWSVSLKWSDISFFGHLKHLVCTVYHNMLLKEKNLNCYIFVLVVQKGNRNKWSCSLKMTRIPQCLMPGPALLSRLLVNMSFVFGFIYFSLMLIFRL